MINKITLCVLIMGVLCYIAYGTWEHQQIEKENKSARGPYILVMTSMGVVLLMFSNLIAVKIFAECNMTQQIQRLVDHMYGKAKAMILPVWKLIKHKGGENQLMRMGLAVRAQEYNARPQVGQSQKLDPFKNKPFNVVLVTYVVMAAIGYVSYGVWEDNRIKAGVQASTGPYILVMVTMGILLILLLLLFIQKMNLDGSIRKKIPSSIIDTINRMVKILKKPDGSFKTLSEFAKDFYGELHST